MIEYVEGWNFQTYKHIKVEFDSLVTTITGPTDSGKSTILRLIKWIVSNSPSPKKVVKRKKGKDGKVIYKSYVKGVLGVDGHTITRIKSKKRNIYKIDNQKPLKAVGRGVPPEIAVILKIDVDINFQGQHHPPFWLSKTAGQISKDLNEIVDLTVIDDTISTINQMVRDEKSHIKVTKERLEESKRKKKELQWIVSANAKLLELEDQQKEIDKLETKKQELENLLEEIDKLEQTKRNKIVGFEEIETLTKEVDKLSSQYNELQRLLKWIKMTEEESCDERNSGILLEKELHKMMKGRECPLCHQRIPKS